MPHRPNGPNGMFRAPDMEYTGRALMRILQRKDFYRAQPPLGQKKKPLSSAREV